MGDAPPLRLHDDADLIPNARMRWQVSGPTEPVGRRPRGFVEMNWTGVRGEDKGVDFELAELSGSYVIEFRPKERSHLELGAGLAYTHTQLDVVDDETEKRLGIRVQLSPSVDLTDFLAIYGRLALTGMVDDSAYDQIELGLAWRINEIVALNAGYRWWHYQNDDFQGTAVDEVDVYTKGVVVGLMLSM